MGLACIIISNLNSDTSGPLCSPSTTSFLSPFLATSTFQRGETGRGDLFCIPSPTLAVYYCDGKGAAREVVVGEEGVYSSRSPALHPFD